MDPSMNHRVSQTNQSTQSNCLDVSPDRLRSMSPSELEQAMEEALSVMTDETYDPAVIDAYLDALDCVAPLPPHPDAAASYASFCQKVCSRSERLAPPPASAPVRRPRRTRTAMRAALAAAVTAACLVGGAVAAQAAGIDVFGAMARWTEDAFSFGMLPNEYNAMAEDDSEAAQSTANQTSPDVSYVYGEVPEEYQEAQAAFAERGLPFCYMKAPEGFEVCDTLLYVFPHSDMVVFDIMYSKNEHFISFSLAQTDGTSSTIYEKDDTEVETFVYNGIVHYIFHNVTNYTPAWMDSNNIEYSVSTTGSLDELKELIRSIYEE